MTTRWSRLASAVSLALFMAACGDDVKVVGGGTTTPTPTPTPTPTTPANRSPVITAITVTPDVGVSGLTIFTISATATDADNDTLTYSWVLVSTPREGQSVQAGFVGDGPQTITLTVTDGKGGTVSQSRAVTIGRMTGDWEFKLTGFCAGGPPASWPTLSLVQTGTVVTGTVTAPAAWCSVPAGQNGIIDGGAAIDADGNLTGVRVKFPIVDFFLTGKMGSTGRQVVGTSRTALGTNTFELNKK